MLHVEDGDSKAEGACLLAEDEIGRIYEDLWLDARTL